ncbi:peptidoglycan-binding protein [Pelagibacterium montanilacus]|uniref:peptidoglycan-binding protein n=1 Tax=Pelagibacterium montanilacus TaxID=2185280 RepID=UPI000F8E5C00|nr:peptidoglycan-binding protein [Pelagibacterium montanilacus]
MARTNPHHDWDEPVRRRTPERAPANAEWDSLRNELVALLDHVEDQMRPPQPAPAPRARASYPEPATERPADRQSQALRSVQRAVERMTDRSETRTAPASSEDHVARAISQIRARRAQSASAPKPAPAASPAPAAPRTNDELEGFARRLESLGQRIERFEASIGARFDTLENREDIAAQVGQLSEVIELLAGAVGETGQVKRIEGQIERLAQTILETSGQTDTLTPERIEEMTVAIERLAAEQEGQAGRTHDAMVRATDRQDQALVLIEKGVRSIYDRLDAIEASGDAPLHSLEAMSRDIASLVMMIEDRTDLGTLVERMDTLNARMASMEETQDGTAQQLERSIGSLRGAVQQALDPRFDALEDRLGALGSQIEHAAAAPELVEGMAGVESQLRHLAQRIEESGRQIADLAAARQAEAQADEPFDLDRLADLIAARTAPSAPETPAEGIEKSDLAAVEERLSGLISARASAQQSGERLDGVRDSIAQVDSRLARLESMLNGSDTPERMIAVPAQDAAPMAAPYPPRRKPRDAMPADPVSGEPAAAPFGPEAPDRAARTPQFKIDPSLIERPSKPEPSFAQEPARDGAKARASRPEPAKAAIAANPAPAPASAPEVERRQEASRSSFIEAARRSARHPAGDDAAAPQSLIAKAMARFQRAEQELDDAEPAAEPARTPSPQPERRDDPVASRPEPGMAAFASQHKHEDYTTQETEVASGPGFLARNRRPLLLGTALIIAIALGAHLLINRTPSPQALAPASAGTESAPAEPAPAPSEPAEQNAPETSVIEPADAPSDGGSNLMSSVPMTDQPPRLASGNLDSATILGAQTIDPVQTASLGPATIREIGRSQTPAPQTSATLPSIEVPEGVQPEALRTAAEAGDRFAQFEVGAILTEGLAVTQDLAAAAAWYERSAAQGFAPAQYRLGNLYESGQGVDRDLEQARLWYQRAAEAGNRMSMHNLASLHAGGELEGQDFEAAAYWFEQAAARGLTDSQFNLGMLHARGLGVEQDFEDSYVWFSLAARSDDADAANAREDVVRSLDADTLQRLNAEVEGWTPAQIDMAANFAPIGTWDPDFESGEAIANSEVVLRVQQLLGKLGYDVGVPDGVFGPRTGEAIAAFERETGMTESGEVNPRLLAVLGSQPV